MDWFLYDNGLRHESVKLLLSKTNQTVVVRNMKLFCKSTPNTGKEERQKASSKCLSFREINKTQLFERLITWNKTEVSLKQRNLSIILFTTLSN